ncbi:MAG: hypothetical protein RXR19_03610, partial [Nitrososphaeria archaeon]
ASNLSFKFKLSSSVSGEGNPLVYFKDSADAYLSRYKSKALSYPYALNSLQHLSQGIFQNFKANFANLLLSLICYTLRL